jgi:hypothetical protein
MKHPPARPFLVALLVIGSGSLPAQISPTLSVPLLPAPTVVASDSERPRAVSPEIASKLAASRPKFVPPSEVTAAGNPVLTRTASEAEADKPRNGIIRLPQHIVREQRLPNFKDREILTPTGKLELAYKRYPGLRFGSLPFLSNNRVAMGMLEDEFRLERMAEMNDLLGLTRISNPNGANSLRKGAAPGFLRSGEWIASPAGNPDGSRGLWRIR